MTLAAIISMGVAAVFGAAQESVLASDRTCGPAAVPCLPTVTEHGPVADVSVPPPPMVEPSGPVRATDFPGRDLAPTAVQPLDARRDILPSFDGTDVVLSSELVQKTAGLANCRLDAARVRAVRPADLPEEAIHLRLWIAPDGRVTDSRVSTTGAIGLDFLGCLKRQVREWWLLPPTGGKGAFVDVEVKLPARGQPRLRPLVDAVS